MFSTPRAQEIADRVEAFVRTVVVPYEGDPRCGFHGPSDELVMELREKARAAGVGAGIHFWGEPEKQAELLGFGANFLIHSADLLLVRKHLTNELLKIRELMGDSGEGKEAGDSVNI